MYLGSHSYSIGNNRSAEYAAIAETSIRSNKIARVHISSNISGVGAEVKGNISAGTQPILVCNIAEIDRLGILVRNHVNNNFHAVIIYKQAVKVFGIGSQVIRINVYDHSLTGLYVTAGNSKQCVTERRTLLVLGEVLIADKLLPLCGNIIQNIGDIGICISLGSLAKFYLIGLAAALDPVLDAANLETQTVPVVVGIGSKIETENQFIFSITVDIKLNSRGIGNITQIAGIHSIAVCPFLRNIAVKHVENIDTIGSYVSFHMESVERFAVNGVIADVMQLLSEIMSCVRTICRDKNVRTDFLICRICTDILLCAIGGLIVKIIIVNCRSRSSKRRGARAQNGDCESEHKGNLALVRLSFLFPVILCHK